MRQDGYHHIYEDARRPICVSWCIGYCRDEERIQAVLLVGAGSLGADLMGQS
jgi:hypothetical protein